MLRTAFELCLPVPVYSKINHYVLSVLFFPALIAIAMYEKHWEKKHSDELKDLIQDDEDEVSQHGIIWYQSPAAKQLSR